MRSFGACDTARRGYDAAREVVACLLCSRASLLCVSLPCLALPLPCLALPAAVALVRSRQLPTVFVRTYSQHEPIFSELPHDEERKQRHLPQCIPCHKHSSPQRSPLCDGRKRSRRPKQTAERPTRLRLLIAYLRVRLKERVHAARDPQRPTRADDAALQRAKVRSQALGQPRATARHFACAD